MRATLSLFRREFSAYFFSPIAYVVLAIFLIVTGSRFAEAVNQLTALGPRGTEYPMHLMFSDTWFWLVFLFIPPLLTMRLFAEERSTGNLEMLLTSPLREWQIVAAKFLACFAFYLMMWLPTLSYLPILLDLEGLSWTSPETIFLVGGMNGVVVAILIGIIATGTMRWLGLMLFCAAGMALGIGLWKATQESSQLHANIDPMPVLTTYLGFMMVGAMFLAIGLLVSSLVRSQMVSALVSMFVSMLFVVAGFWLRQPDMDIGSETYRIQMFFTVPLHFDRLLCRGQIDTRQLVLYASVTFFCLFMTVRSLESRRWR